MKVPPALLAIALIAIAEPLLAAEEPVEQVRPGLIVPGGVTFQLAWSLASIVGANVNRDAEEGNDNNAWPLFVPVAGPFIAMGLYNGGNPGAASALFIANGLTQVAGVAMIVAGIAARETVLVASADGVALRGSF